MINTAVMVGEMAATPCAKSAQTPRALVFSPIDFFSESVDAMADCVVMALLLLCVAGTDTSMSELLLVSHWPGEGDQRWAFSSVGK